MPRKLFDRELTELMEQMAEMGNTVDGRIERTIEALRTQDLKAAAEIAGSDRPIDEKENLIEKACLDLIALQQPIASDLRMIAACLKILTDMERVADHCADICEIIASEGLNGNTLALTHVVKMLEAARAMYRGSVDVLLSGDAPGARAVCKADDEVDAMFSRIVLEVCGGIAERPQDVMQDVDMIFITKYIERMADHATNIAEWVIYMETGEHPDLNAKMA